MTERMTRDETTKLFSVLTRVGIGAPNNRRMDCLC